MLIQLQTLARPANFLAALVLSLQLFCVSALAADTAPNAALVNSNNLSLQVLAGACANCHGTDGRLGGAIPAIAGRPAGILEAQLLAFKRGEQPNATVMTRHAAGYSDAELAALAAYFSSLNR